MVKLLMVQVLESLHRTSCSGVRGQGFGLRTSFVLQKSVKLVSDDGLLGSLYYTCNYGTVIFHLALVTCSSQENFTIQFLGLTYRCITCSKLSVHLPIWTNKYMVRPHTGSFSPIYLVAYVIVFLVSPIQYYDHFLLV